MCHVEDAIEVDRHNVLPVFDHRLRISGEGIAVVDAGIVDKDRDPADLLANLLGDNAAPLGFGHVQHKAKGPAAGGCDGLNGLGRRVAIYVDHSDLRSLPRIAQRDRSAYTRPTSCDHCNAFLEKPGHFIVPIAQRIANYQKMIRSASETLHESERSRSAARCQLRTHAVQQTETLFNHLVGGYEQLVRHGDVEHPCRAGVDDQLKLGRLNNRQVHGLSTLENSAGIDANLTIRVPDVESIAHQSADFSVFTHI